MKTSHMKIALTLSIAQGDARIPVRLTRTIDPDGAVQDGALEGAIAALLDDISAEATAELLFLAAPVIDRSQARALRNLDPAQGRLPVDAPEPKRPRRSPKTPPVNEPTNP